MLSNKSSQQSNNSSDKTVETTCNNKKKEKKYTTKRKSQKEEAPEKDVVPSLPEGWDRCHAYLSNKHRFCRQMKCSPDVPFCGAHRPQEEAETDANGKQQSPQRKRIPCPLDPSHSIYEDALQRHLLKCPMATKRSRIQNQPYYKEGINLGGHGDDSVLPQTKRSKSRPIAAAGSLEWAQCVALRVLQVYQQIFLLPQSSSSAAALSNTTTKDSRLLSREDLYHAIPTNDFSENEIDRGIQNGLDRHRIKAGGHCHVLQLASLVGHLRDMGAISTTPETPVSNNRLSPTTETIHPQGQTVFLELGAGRGMFGLTASGVAAAATFNSAVQHSTTTMPTTQDDERKKQDSPPPHLLMVERQGSRAKAEKFLRNIPEEVRNSKGAGCYLNLSNVTWRRIACDIANVDFQQVFSETTNATNQTHNHNTMRPMNVVPIAKHLCGAGTDIALRALEPIKDQIHSCAFATCCHGVCDWKLYVGRDFLRNAMMACDGESVTHSSNHEGDDKPPTTATSINERSSLAQFGEEEFHLMRQWSAGSASQRRNGKNNSPSSPQRDPPNVSLHEANGDHEEHHCSIAPVASVTGIVTVVDSLKLQCGIEGLGRACQRLIDYGRTEYMRKILFQTDGASVSLCHYISPDVTPQNALLRAVRVLGNR